MNIKLVTASVLAGVLVLPLAGRADTDSDRSSPKAFVKDSVITTKVKAKLAKEKLSSTVHIRVDTDNRGIVSLSGTARSQADADKAVAIAQGVEGVTSVENNLRIKADDERVAR
jgi:hyperosmotically inducible periplasmic protein